MITPAQPLPILIGTRAELPIKLIMHEIIPCKEAEEEEGDDDDDDDRRIKTNKNEKKKKEIQREVKRGTKSNCANWSWIGKR